MTQLLVDIVSAAAPTHLVVFEKRFAVVAVAALHCKVMRGAVGVASVGAAEIWLTAMQNSHGQS